MKQNGSWVLAYVDGIGLCCFITDDMEQGEVEARQITTLHPEKREEQLGWKSQRWAIVGMGLSLNKTARIRRSAVLWWCRPSEFTTELVERAWSEVVRPTPEQTRRITER